MPKIKIQKHENKACIFALNAVIYTYKWRKVVGSGSKWLNLSQITIKSYHSGSQIHKEKW